MSVFTAPVVGWLLHCFLPSAFVIAHHHATVDALVAGCFCCQSLSTAATTPTAAATKPPPPPPPRPWLNSPSSIAKERGNSSTTTSVPTAAPTSKRLQVLSTWTYLSYLQYLKCVMLIKGI
jgi:hypothetical protein